MEWEAGRWEIEGGGREKSRDGRKEWEARKEGKHEKKREDEGKEKMKKEILFSIFEHFSLLNTYSWNSALGAWRKKDRLTEY